MKISKRQLKRIVREEKHRLLKEYDYDQDYVVHPTEYVKGAMELLSPEEFNRIGIEKMMREAEVAAMELRNTWPEDEGFGSSDRTYELQGFLEMLGFKTGFPNGTLEVVREGKRKISKRQLKRIIKEERAKILNENSPIANARYMQGNYSDVSAIDAVESALYDLAAGTDRSALEDFGDEIEADEAATAAVTITVADTLQSLGMLAQYDALIRSLR